MEIIPSTDELKEELSNIKGGLAAQKVITCSIGIIEEDR